MAGVNAERSSISVLCLTVARCCLRRRNTRSTVDTWGDLFRRAQALMVPVATGAPMETVGAQRVLTKFYLRGATGCVCVCEPLDRFCGRICIEVLAQHRGIPRIRAPPFRYRVPSMVRAVPSAQWATYPLQVPLSGYPPLGETSTLPLRQSWASVDALNLASTTTYACTLFCAVI